MSALDSLTSFLAGETTSHKFSGEVHLRMGLITAVSGSGTATVQVGGDSTTSIPGIAYIGGKPEVNKPVLLLQQGANSLFVLGTPSNAATNNTPLTDVAYLSQPNVFSQVNTFSAGLLSNGGAWRVDAQGRVMHGGPIVNTSAFLALADVNTNHPGSATALYGEIAQFKYPSTTTATGYNFYSEIRTAAAAFTMSSAAHFVAGNPTLGAASAITSLYGLNVFNQGVGGVTNAYGINVGGQGGAATLNVGVRIDTSTTAALWLGGDQSGTTVTGGITFGSGRDTVLYRSAAGVLKTDSGMVIGNTSGGTVRSLVVNTAGTSGVREVQIKDTSQSSPSGYGAYPGAWTSALVIYSNDNSRGIWLSPLDTGSSANARLTTFSTGFDVYVNSNGSSTAGSQALSVSTGGILTLPLGLIVSGGDFQVDAQGRVAQGGPVVNTSAFHVLADVFTNHPGSATALYGCMAQYKYPSTTTLSGYNFYSEVRTAAAAFTMTSGVGFYANSPTLGASSAITTLSGFLVSNQGVAGVTNAYGLNIAGQSGAATLNVGARIDTGSTVALWLGGDAAGTTVTGGLAFGSSRDVTLYRSAASTLSLNGNAFVDTLGRFGIGASILSDRYFEIGNGNTHPGNGVALYGIVLNPNIPSTTTTSYYGFYNQTRTNAASFTLTTSINFYSVVPVYGASSLVTTAYGFLTDNLGAANVTNAYGLNIGGQSGATTLNIGARIDTSSQGALWLGGDAAGTTQTGGIVFGSSRDVNLYRHGSNRLGTDDILVITQGGTSGRAVSNSNVGDKIHLWGSGGNGADYGIGIQASRLVLAVPSGALIGIRVASSSGDLTSGSEGVTLDPTGIVNASTGFRVNGAATSGNYLRGDGTNFVSSAIQAGDFTPSFSTPSFVNSWANNGSGQSTGRYTRDASGFVHVEGCITGGSPATTAFTLPAGSRPSTQKGFWCSGAFGASLQVVIDTSGNVIPQAGGPVYLDGILFYPS